jgi:uncharacterized protein YjiS (DUF1127 family)
MFRASESTARIARRPRPGRLITFLLSRLRRRNGRQTLDNLNSRELRDIGLERIGASYRPIPGLARNRDERPWR